MNIPRIVCVKGLFNVRFFDILGNLPILILILDVCQILHTYCTERLIFFNVLSTLLMYTQTRYNNIPRILKSWYIKCVGYYLTRDKKK